MSRLSDAFASGAFAPTPRHPLSAVQYRVALAAAVALSAAIGIVACFDATSAGAVRVAGPELTSVLRFMAVVKAAMALGAGSLAWWRLGCPVGPGVALPCIAACALMAAAPGLIWSMEHVVLGAALFHAGLLLILILSWADRGEVQAIALGKRRFSQRRVAGTATSLRRNGGSVQGGS